MMLASLETIDIDVLSAINLDRARSLDGFFQLLTNSTPYICGFIPIAFILVGIVRKNERWRVDGYKIAASYLLSVVVSNVLKYVIDRPRPFVTYPFIQKLSTGGSGSFPSGHTSDVFAIVTALLLLMPNRMRVASLYLWALLVGYSRLDLGVHYPSDVIGGALIGIVSAYVVCRLAYRDQRQARLSD